MHETNLVEFGKNSLDLQGVFELDVISLKAE